MLKCLECGETFFEPRIVEEMHGFNDGGPYEKIAICRNCGSDAIETAYDCQECGEYFLSDEMIANHCEACVDKFIETDSLEMFIKYLKSIEVQKMGTYCWIDFVLCECFGIMEISDGFSSSSIEKIANILAEHIEPKEMELLRVYIKLCIEQYIEWRSC